MKCIPNPAAVQIARDLESMMDALRPSAEADAKLAFFALLHACHDVLDRLDALADAPPVSGGSPDDDDHEELCEQFQSDPEGWPEAFDDECDGYRWTTEPVPVDVLAASAPFDADYDAWLDRLDAARDGASVWTDADQIAVHGCC